MKKYGRKISAKAEIAANQHVKEKSYWLNQLSGISGKSYFTYDYNYNRQSKEMETEPGPPPFDSVEFRFSPELFAGIMKLSSGSDPRLHMILLAGLVILLNRYTGSRDIIVGTPVYKPDIEGEFINTVLAFRHRVKDHQAFKKILPLVRQTMIEADENQDYPIEILVKQLNLSLPDTNGFPLFDTALMLENIHDRGYLRHIPLNMVFSFLRTDTFIRGVLEYNPYLYNRRTVRRIVHYYEQLLQNALEDIDLPVSHIDILPLKEKERLLHDFNNTEASYPQDKTIHELFEQQVEKTPDNTALIGGNGLHPMSYRELNQKVNPLARVLRRSGVGAESIVGIMMDRSIDMVIGLLAILKAGGAYLPIDPGTPVERVLFMMKDSGARILLTSSQNLKGIPFTTLRDFDSNREIEIVKTNPRQHIKAFNSLPMPDRSLINLGNYRNKIGMASVTNAISLQATRGCPYECLFCHKIWSKNHIYRSAENIYHEIEYWYKNGVTNFAFIDDCFNLNREKSSQVFQLIIKNKLKIQVFFPNGLRGDIMTPGYIDLMVEAGTRGINLSLETASPRLQKLIRKNLDLDKFKAVVDYIAREHPEIILEMATMHGLPTETEEEAMMTLNFIKDVHWLHFPYIHILKIFPNTEMETFALEQGISREDIMISKDRAFHELPETLPFPKRFTRRYQADFMNNYFLGKERLHQVLPVQMKILNEEALCQKYDAYLPVEIKSLEDIIRFVGLEDLELPENIGENRENIPPIFNRAPEIKTTKPGARKILLLDLSQHFSSHSMLYRVMEQPLGLISLLTYLKQQFGDKIDGRIYKSGSDFDNFAELKGLLDEYKPDMVGIRTLTFFKEFFHETVSQVRQWGFDGPLITGGPYASSDYDTLLKDKNIDMVVLGEGEYTLEELIGEMLANGFKLPPGETLNKIKGIAYAKSAGTGDVSRQVILPDRLDDTLAREDTENLQPFTRGDNLAYVMYTSGSTGTPKGVMVEHRQVNNCIYWMHDKFHLKESDVIVNRTALTFDPSVWEIFWPLYIGGGVRVLTEQQSKDVEFLINLMAEDNGLTMMYCPATLVTAMTDRLNREPVQEKMKLPWLIIGAEPISMDTIKYFYSRYEGTIVNTYGPTECTINNTYYDLKQDDPRAVVPIGKPVANNCIYILSPELQLRPLKTTGEICIAGDSVARGYINDIKKTAGSFIDHPFRNGRLYKTGDIGRWLEDGNVEIMGRLDEQVKLRGYRIELAEIESALKKHPSVRDCVAVVKKSKEAWDKRLVCKKCGITTRCPGIKLNDEGICNICENYPQTKKNIDAYFKTLADLEHLLQKENQGNGSTYDCLLLYSGGRGAGYALYKLVEMGFRVLAVTYDNGYFGKADLDNIKKITSTVGVDHRVLTHRNSDKILGESIKTAATVCRGCFHTSFSLAAEYAYHHHIKVVIGATLSRGQIIENRLFMFLQQGITEVMELENEILKLQEMTPEIDKNMFNFIDIDVVNDGSIHERVKFLDFYRYCSLTNEEMITYLDHKDPYWKDRKESAVYSTNCPLKQFGDYAHLQEKGFHYYGSATSWEKRLGHLTLENVKDDLTCRVKQKGYENFLKRIGFPRAQNPGKADEYLCAYYVPTAARDRKGSEGNESELRDFLLKSLPVYMIPTYFVRLDQLPLTSNGKIDKKALPEPRMKSSEDYAAPGNETEEKLVEIWSLSLEVEPQTIGINSNFFELGGHSLKVLNLVNAVEREFKVKVNFQDVFQFPTIKGLHDLIRNSDRTDHMEIEKQPDSDYYELSYSQKRLWLLHQFAPDDPAFNLPEKITLYEPIDENRVRKVFEKLVERHDAFRTYFKKIKGEPVQIIRDFQRIPPIQPGNQYRVNLEVVDISHLNDSEREKRRAQIFEEESKVPFKLETPPLFRTKLVKCKEEEFDVILTMHHIITDGWSMEVLEREFAILYESDKNKKKGENHPGLKPLRIQYKDYANWHNQLLSDKERMRAAKEFWETQLSGESFILDLPYDFPKNNLDSKTSAAYRIVVPETVMLGLKKIAKERKASLFMVLLAGFNLLMSRITGQENILLGVPGAARQHEDLKNIIGVFVNTLILRNKVNPGETFTTFLEKVQDNMLQVLEHQSYPLELICSEFKVRYPDISVFFNMSTFGNTLKENLKNDESYHIEQVQNAKFDIVSYVGEYKNGIEISTHYYKELFKPVTIEKMMRMYLMMLENISNDPGSALRVYYQSPGKRKLKWN